MYTASIKNEACRHALWLVEIDRNSKQQLAFSSNKYVNNVISLQPATPFFPCSKFNWNITLLFVINVRMISNTLVANYC